MRAIILAAGRGSRMGDATQNLPKCRSILQGRELIQWQLDALRKSGITDIAIVTGYLSDTFNFDLVYFKNEKWNVTNMVRSLTEARDWLESEECIVSYSDIVYSPRVIKKLSEAAGEVVLTYDPHWKNLWSLRFEDPLDDAETFKTVNGKVTEIGRRATDFNEIEGQYMGLLKFSPEGWREVEGLLNTFSATELDKLDMTSLLQSFIEANGTINCVPIDDSWYEVDSLDDLNLYNELGVNFS